MIKRRTVGREQHRGSVGGSSHLIKIGFNSGEERSARPGKLTGFLVVRNEVRGDGFYPTDIQVMTTLINAGIAESPQMRRAWSEALAEKKLSLIEGKPLAMTDVLAVIGDVVRTTLPENILPKKLEFALPGNARHADGRWTFPGIYNDAYVAYKVGGCPGEFCRGNGETAMRWQKDGTRKQIECVPYGASGVDDPAKFCPFSAPHELKRADGSPMVDKKGNAIVGTECKAKGSLCVILIVRDESGRFVPVARMAEARFVFETTSETVQEWIGGQLLDAANRLQGQLGSLTGAMLLAPERTAMPHHVGGGNTVVRRVKFSLNEWDIASREAAHRQERLLESQVVQRALALPSPVAPIPAPPPGLPQFDDDDGVIEGDWNEDSSDRQPHEDDEHGDDATKPADDLKEPTGKNENAAPKASASGDFLRDEHVALMLERIPEATTAQLVSALTEYCGAARTKTGEPKLDFWKRVSNGFGTNPQWFAQGANDKERAQRRDALEEICRRAVEGPQGEFFSVESREEYAKAAKDANGVGSGAR